MRHWHSGSLIVDNRPVF